MGEIVVYMIIGAVGGYLIGKHTSLKDIMKLVDQYNKKNRDSNVVNTNHKKDVQNNEIIKTEGVFYLLNLKTLFEKYHIDINDNYAFGSLCHLIERQSKLDILTKFKDATSVDDVLKIYSEKDIIKDYEVNNIINDGPYITEKYIDDQIIKARIPDKERVPIKDKIHVLLMYYYGSGFQTIFKIIGNRLEELEKMKANNDDSLPEQYRKFKDLVDFHMRIYNT